VKRRNSSVPAFLGVEPWLTAILAFVLGCGHSRSEGIIQGAVQCPERTLPVGTRVVVMSMKTGAATAADVRADGAFSAPKRLPPGPYVAFLATAPSPEEPPDAPPFRSRDAKENAPPNAARWIPARYCNEGTTPWSLDVVAGVNNIVLTVEP
jgi:hypothetical protein